LFAARRGPTAVIDANPLRGPAPLTVTFDATRSSAEAGVVDYEWLFADGTPVHAARCMHVFDTQGTSVVRLTVVDAEGRVDEAQVKVVVEASVPIASFSVSVDAPEVGQWVTVDGSASYDPRGLPVDLSWDFGDGSLAQGAVVGHAYGSAGLYTITLVVRDVSGKQSSVRRSLLVQEPPPGGCGGSRPIPLGQ
jgi:PKD repeat protein